MANSDMQWYIDRAKDARENKYYDIFFSVCKRYNVSWHEASAKERAFVEKVARVEFEQSEVLENGFPINSVRPFFGAVTREDI